MSRVLFLGSNDRPALAAARSLGRAGISVDVASIGPSTICEKSRYATRTVDIGDAKGHVQESVNLLADHLSKESYDMLIPMGDAAGELASYARDEISKRTRLAMPSRKAYELCHDKEQTLRLARDLGVPVPPYVVLRQWEDIKERRLAEVRYPRYLKPNYSARIVDDTIAEFRVRKARRQAHLVDFCRFNLGNSPIMLQEECAGIGVGVYLLAKQGQILSMVQQVRLHEPRDGGGGTYRMTTAMDPKLAEYAHTIVAESRWHGVAMIEFKGDPDRGEWALMEINGRFWGSLALTIRAGLDYPLWLYQLYSDPSLNANSIPSEPKLHVRQRHLKKDIGWFAKALPRQSNKAVFICSWIADFRHLLTGNEGLDSESFDDPRPGLWDWITPVSSLGRRLAGFALRFSWMLRYKMTEATTTQQVYDRLRQGKNRILFVCKGNICRSAFAEHYLTQQHGITSARSAGTLMRSKRRSPAAVEQAAGQGFGIDLSMHRSQPLDHKLVNWADVIFVMDYRNLAEVGRAFRIEKPVLLVGSLAQTGPVKDPYNRPPDEISTALKQIKQSVDFIAEVCEDRDLRAPQAQAQVA